MKNQIVRTAIFPLAGLGTRLLPATKATPKELLPVIDKPLIQFAIDEVRAAGIERVIFVTHPSNTALVRYLMDDARLRERLIRHGKQGLADILRDTALDLQDTDVIFVTQHDPDGLGDAVLKARHYALDGPVAVVLPDDLILGGAGCLSEMTTAYRGCGCGHLVATMQVSKVQTGNYGVLSITRQDGRIVHARSIVEKPSPDKAPSQMAVVGRYILDPAIFDALARQGPGADGEVQLTDAITSGAPTIGIAGFRFSGRRFDCGSKRGLLAATLFRARTDPAYADIIGDAAPVTNFIPVG